MPPGVLDKDDIVGYTSGMMEQEAHAKPSKTAIRKQLRERLKHLATEGRKDDLIVEKIRRLDQWNESRQVFAFIPLPSEPDITPLLDLAQKQGKQVLVPICQENGIMHFAPLSQNWRDSLKVGRHNILCPADDDVPGETPRKRLSPVILVPGLGYTADGARIGRGGGYYDRYLQTWGRDLFKIGVCHRVQLLMEIPAEPYDQRVDIVVTD